MSVWKSPVFYFGIFLVMVIALALVAPFTINWNAWKAEMEAYGQKLTGRSVSIAGPVEVRLFPWPRLEARDVRLANAAGFGEAPLLSTDGVTLRLSLAGLFSGSLDVEEIAFDGPQLNLVRNADGAMNWNLSPAEGFSGLVSRVNLDKITVRRGSVWFEDRLHDQSASLTAIDSVVSAEALSGPWRMTGKGQWRDVPVSLSFALGEIFEGKPLRVAATIKPTDSALPAFAVEGEWETNQLTGTARMSAQQEPDGQKSSLDGALKPLAFQSEFTWTRDNMRLDKIRIAPADTKDSGTLIEGSAELVLTSPPKARVKFDSPRINLDSILTSQSLERWQRGGLLALANGIFTGLPKKLVAEFAMDVSVLTLGGETLNSVRLRGVAEREAIRIHEATSDLPGRSRMRFDGIVFPSSEGAELGGALAFESFDFRSFAGWALPSLKDDFGAYWQGARGRLKLQTNINWSSIRFALQDTVFELDGQAGRAQGTWRFGEVPLVDGQVDMTLLDLDNYLGTGDTLSASQFLFGALESLNSALDIGQYAEQRITVEVQSLKLKGARASNVALDYEAGLSGLQLRALDIESLGGASVKAEGLVTNGQDGPLGEFDIVVRAEDVSAMLQMANFTSPTGRPGWQGLLGTTDAKLRLSIGPELSGSALGFSLEGKSGSLMLQGEGAFRKPKGNSEPEIQAKLMASTPELSALLAQYGINSAASAGSVVFEAQLNGTRFGGLGVKLEARNQNAAIVFAGRMRPELPYLGMSGQLSVSSPSLRQFVSLIGAPIQTSADGAFDWQTQLEAKDTEMSVAHQSGTAGGEAFQLDATADAAGSWSFEAEVGTLHLTQVLASVLLPWTATPGDLSQSYAAFTGAEMSWQAFIKPKQLQTSFGSPLAEAVIAVDVNRETRAINVKTPGKALSVDLLMEPKGNTFQVTGRGEARLDLSNTTTTVEGLSLATGHARIAGEFRAIGQSPAAAIAAAEGKGTYWVEDMQLNRLTVDGFAQGLENASQQAALAEVFSKLLSGPGATIGTQTGAVEMKGGEVAFSPLGTTIDNSLVTLNPRVDLNLPELLVAVAVSSQKRADLPALTVTYSGTPGFMETRVANAALAAKLGYELLAQELAALEKLQQQEAEAIRKQEQQRKDDEERFAAFQAQRNELRSHLRIQRFHQQERKRFAQEAESAMTNALQVGDKLNREELRRNLRLLKIRKDLAEPFVQP